MHRQIYRASQIWSLEAIRMTFLSGICGYLVYLPFQVLSNLHEYIPFYILQKRMNAFFVIAIL